MALPFLGSGAKKKDQLVGVDFGAHSTKAVHLQRKGDHWVLLNFAVSELPARGSDAPAEPLDQRLKRVTEPFGGKCRQLAVALSATESVVRQAELPMVPVGDMRTMLKFNAKSYLQQDLPDHVFDCYVLPPQPGVKLELPKAGQKVKVLVGGAKNRMVEDITAAVRGAGFAPEAVVPESICAPNSFEIAHPEAFSKEAVALVDLGFHNSSISLLLNGELVLTRVVAIGGDRVTSALAESLGTSYSEAEGIKVGLAHEVANSMTPVLSPLGRELRASIDYFEHQHDRTVPQVYVSGAASRSEYILQALQTELMVPCVPWNPAAALQSSLPTATAAGLEQAAPLLTVAIGAALAVM